MNMERNVRIYTDEDGKLVLDCPYHPAIPARAKTAGGRFDGGRRVWTFDPRDEARIRQMAIDIFGTDGREQVPTVTVRVDLDTVKPGSNNLFALGRELLHRPGRDASVRLGDKVVLLAGGFPSRAGSARYPELAPNPGTVIEVRDVPLPLAQSAGNGYTIVDATADRRAALEQEAARLRARLAEIEAELASI